MVKSRLHFATIAQHVNNATPVAAMLKRLGQTENRSAVTSVHEMRRSGPEDRVSSSMIDEEIGQRSLVTHPENKTTGAKATAIIISRTVNRTRGNRIGGLRGASCKPSL
jgi:hypothetical protein